MTILPEKIEANIADAAARVAQVRTENALVFPIFTDLHTENPGNADTQQFFRVLQTLCNRIKPNGVIDLGDNLAMLGRKNHIATASVQELLRTIFDAVQTAAGGPLYTINGNHDGVGTDFFKPIVWNDVAKVQYDAGTARYAANSSYYYNAQCHSTEHNVRCSTHNKITFLFNKILSQAVQYVNFSLLKEI